MGIGEFILHNILFSHIIFSALKMFQQICHIWLMSFLLRAPEIALGLPFTEAIDVWGVGCVLAFLYLAQNLFHVDCKYQMVYIM